MKALVEAGSDINALDSDQCSPLHHAAEGNPAVVPVLLEAGVTVNLLNNDQCSPLFKASHNEHWSAVAALMSAGADRKLGLTTQFM